MFEFNVTHNVPTEAIEARLIPGFFYGITVGLPARAAAGLIDTTKRGINRAGDIEIGRQKAVSTGN